jgi:hypothetical protein
MPTAETTTHLSSPPPIKDDAIPAGRMVAPRRLRPATPMASAAEAASLTCIMPIDAEDPEVLEVLEALTTLSCGALATARANTESVQAHLPTQWQVLVGIVIMLNWKILTDVN